MQSYFASDGIQLLLTIICTSKKTLENFSGNLSGVDLFSIQKRLSDFSQDTTFIGCIREDMKILFIDFINKKTEGLIGSSTVSTGIDATKLALGMRLCQRYKAIFGCVHPDQVIYVGRINKSEMQHHLDAMRSYEKKSCLEYKAKTAVFPYNMCRFLNPHKFPFLVTLRQTTQATNLFLMSFMHLSLTMCPWKGWNLWTMLWMGFMWFQVGAR